MNAVKNKVYEPFTIADLWHSYQIQLNLSGEGIPYINKGDKVILKSKEELKELETSDIVLNYAGCLFTVTGIMKIDDDLYGWVVNDGQRDFTLYDSDIETVYKEI